MTELELNRTKADRRRYVLEGVGTLRLEGLASRRATAESGGTTWRFDRRGFWRSSIAATEASGAIVGEFHPNALRRGGRLGWDGRELELRPASVWRQRYALAAGDRELAVFDAKGWGRRPVKVSLGNAAAVEPGLLLFAAFVTRALAADESAASAGGSSAAVSSGG